MNACIRPVEPDDLDEWLDLRRKLWGGERIEHRAEVGKFLADGTLSGMPHAVFVAEDKSDPPCCTLVGFAECSMRTGVAADVQFVAHLEGWYVSPEVRRQGIGRALISAVMTWARQRGCSQLTSDTTLSYAALSTPAHLACGFRIDTAVGESMGPAEDGTLTVGFSMAV